MLLSSSWGISLRNAAHADPRSLCTHREQSIGYISNTSTQHHGLFSLDRTGGPRKGVGSPQILAGSGYCKWFNVRMGFGFISMTSSEGKPVDPPLDVFVHQVSPIMHVLGFSRSAPLTLFHVICSISLTSAADVLEESRSKHALVFSSPVTLRTPKTHLHSPLISSDEQRISSKHGGIYDAALKGTFIRKRKERVARDIGVYSPHAHRNMSDKPANMSENVSHGAHDDQTVFTTRLLKNGKRFRWELLY